MNELNSIEAQSNLDAIPLSDQTKFRLNEINKIKDYFNSEIQERKTMGKKLSKYIAAFDYIDKTLIVLSAASGGISIISFRGVIRIPTGIANVSFTIILNDCGLATNSALTAVENKIPNVSNLVTKTNYNTKISEIEKKFRDNNHDKYITIPELNKLITENFKARLARANLITKTDLDTEMKKN